MNRKITRLLGLFMVMFTMSLPTLASSSYYSKVVATAVGGGKVYASKTQTDSPAYTDGSSEASTNSSSNIATYYLYAQPNEGNIFAGWYEDAECSGNAASTEANYTVSITAESTNQSSPTTKTFYAKFVSARAPILGYTESRIYANISEGTYKNETLTATNISDAITYESSNENVATVAADGTVTLMKNGTCYIKAKANGVEGTYTLTVIDDLTAGVTQIGNGDFENWSSVTSSNHAPNNWNSFETAEGSFASLSSAQQVQMVEDARPGSDGIYCVDIWARSILGVVAQGNLTTGCINAGATTATDKANHNFSKTSDPTKSETLSQIPTAIRFWAKFVPAAANAQHPNARMEAVVHDNYDYITYGDPTYESDEEKSHVIAKASKSFPTTDGEWVEFTVPFELTNNAANGQLHIIVSLTTNADPGQGQANDHLYIDDIELLYDKVTLTMTAAKYATFCAPFDVNVPYGMTAYTVNGISQNNYTLDMTEVTGTIPANTPVVLEGDEEVSLTVYGVAVPETAEAGLLTGVYEDTPAPVGSYVLQRINDVVGFYQVTEGQQPTVKANRCYLTVPDSNVRAFFFNTDAATGLSDMSDRSDNSVQSDVIYNLTGQRIQQMQRGINIVKGKKILVK